MRRRWRWVVVVCATAILAALPAVIAARPAGHSPVSAAALLRQVQDSGSLRYSGYAESSGGLALPVTDQFSSLADLFGGQTQLRVWRWGSTDWRVDTITLTGESDVHQIGADVWTWNYESNQATLTVEPSPPPVRLPTSGDLLPTTLASRLLSEATPQEVTRLPVRRVAGRDAPGLRLRPNDPASTIDEVDVWVDPGSGAALRVDVRGAGVTVVSTQFLDFTAGSPPASDIAFKPPPSVRIQESTDPDLAALINRLGQASPPASLGGIGRNPELSDVGSIGVYGRGVTEFAATPLFGRIARSLRRELSATPGVTTGSAGQEVSIGPLSLVLTPDISNPAVPGRFAPSAWLLTGTVTSAKLVAAAAELTASD